MAMTEGLFKEIPTERIAHSAISALMNTDPGFGYWAQYMADFSMPTASKSVEATTRWGTTTAKNQTAFNAAFKTELPFFDYLAQNRDLNKLFAGYMKSAGHSQGTNVKHLLNGFDWTGVGEGIVVDVSISAFPDYSCIFIAKRDSYRFKCGRSVAHQAIQASPLHWSIPI